jgi:hypothetical protein
VPGIVETGFESIAPLAVSQVDAATWETTAPLVYHSNTRTISIPIGSRTDWASVPGVLSWLIGRMTGAAAAVMHDYCYRVLCPAGDLSYREADQLLVEALGSLGISVPRRWLMWDAVRITSILTRRGGRSEAWRDIPAMVAITIPGLILASPALLLLPPLALFAAVEYLTTKVTART